ncbi:cytochrome P450 [Pisolithus croceorrhizus]|nr:cytochrome P450 [Pisolithus croceorrhizus]KAI6127828.1 cytochrome P450 [Pisolithus croceorrhizus]KAI6150110.1 cytochrome P450 [Pisolithus thermaeus]
MRCTELRGLFVLTELGVEGVHGEWKQNMGCNSSTLFLARLKTTVLPLLIYQLFSRSPYSPQRPRSLSPPDMITSLLWLDLCLTGVGIYLIKRIVSRKNPAPFPPGPKSLPLLGNLLDMPSEKQWLTFHNWANKFGDMTHLEIFGQHIIILNSAKAAVEMLEKKSSIYSDHPVLPMGGELVGWKDSLILLPYGDRFREHRRNFHRVLGSRPAVSVYYPIEEEETHKFLQHVLAEPADLNVHLRATAGAVFLFLFFYSKF